MGDDGSAPYAGRGRDPEPTGRQADQGELDAYGLPVSSSGGLADPYGLVQHSGPSRFGADAGDPFAASRGPRIEPSPPPQRSKLVLGLGVGLALGLLLFGATGFFVGRNSVGDRESAKPVTPASAPASATPSAFERQRTQANQAKLGGALTAIAQGWIPELHTCVSSADRQEGVAENDKVKANDGEKVRVECGLDDISFRFIEYTSVDERNKARDNAEKGNIEARTLARSAQSPAQKAAPSGRTNGQYIEYAYVLTDTKPPTTVAALWWDDLNAPVAAYALTYWKNSLGESWTPMRELWNAHA